MLNDPRGLPQRPAGRSPLEQYIRAAVVNPGPTTLGQFKVLRALLADAVGQRWELSFRGALEAVDPILRRVAPPISTMSGTVRRARVI